MGKKWTAAQRKKFIATMAQKKAEQGKAKGFELPLEMIPMPPQRAVVKRVSRAKEKPLATQEAEALGEIIANTWLALCRKNRGL